MKKYVAYTFLVAGDGERKNKSIKNYGKVKKSPVKGLHFCFLFVIMLKGEKREREAL